MYQQTITLRDGTPAKLTVRDMLPGDEGVRRTLSDAERLALRDATDPEIVRIAAKYRNGSDIDTARGIYGWLIRNYKYVSDGDREFLTAPRISIRGISPYRYFDCDDMSVLLASMMTAAGIRTAYKALAWRVTNPPEQFTHLYILVNVGDGWIPVDPVMGKHGFGNERPTALRTMIREVGSKQRVERIAETTGLADGPETNWDALGREAAARIFRGDDFGVVIKDIGKQVCVDGVKKQLYEYRFAIAGGVIAILGVAMGGGYLVGKRSKHKGIPT